jgi:hypothetical protein
MSQLQPTVRQLEPLGRRDEPTRSRRRPTRASRGASGRGEDAPAGAATRGSGVETGRPSLVVDVEKL